MPTISHGTLSEIGLLKSFLFFVHKDYNVAFLKIKINPTTVKQIKRLNNVSNTVNTKLFTANKLKTKKMLTALSYMKIILTAGIDSLRNYMKDKTTSIIFKPYIPYPSWTYKSEF